MSGDVPRRPPLPSRATRRPSRASRGAGKKRTVGPDRRIRVAESFFEADVFATMLARPEVADLLEQPAAIEYLDVEGRKRRHTFDAIVVLRDGSRIALVIKPAAVAIRQRTDELVARLARDVPAHVADGVLLVTERDVGRDTLHDAKLVNGARLHPRPEHDEAFLAELRACGGTATIAALSAASCLGGDGFRAAARLIGFGTLRKASPGRISPETLVTSSTRTEAAA